MFAYSCCGGSCCGACGGTYESRYISKDDDLDIDDDLTPLVPLIPTSGLRCSVGDPSVLAINGEGGVPYGFVHADIECAYGVCHDYEGVLRAPYRDSEANMVREDGTWTIVLPLDSNTKNVSSIADGRICMTFIETDELGEEMPALTTRRCVNISGCVRPRIIVSGEFSRALSCEIDGEGNRYVSFRGYGASPYAEINFSLDILSDDEELTRGFTFDGIYANARGEFTFNVPARVTSEYGDECTFISDYPSSVSFPYRGFFFQTNDDGYLRESRAFVFSVDLENCCGMLSSVRPEPTAYRTTSRAYQLPFNPYSQTKPNVYKSVHKKPQKPKRAYGGRREISNAVMRAAKRFVSRQQYNPYSPRHAKF